MEDQAARAAKDTKAWTVRLRKGEGEVFLKRVSEKAKNVGAEILVLDGDMVFGKDHVRSAFYHAKKAMDEGRNASDSLSMETLLYASGERQLNSAIEKMSVDEETENAVVVQLTGGNLESDAQWTAMSDVPGKVERHRLERFGIEKEILETVSDDKAVELVLEKVASVDILKK